MILYYSSFFNHRIYVCTHTFNSEQEMQHISNFKNHSSSSSLSLLSSSSHNSSSTTPILSNENSRVDKRSVRTSIYALLSSKSSSVHNLSGTVLRLHALFLKLFPDDCRCITSAKARLSSK